MLAIALVLGEFTISSLLSFNTLQVVIFALGKRDAFVSVAVSFAALIFAFSCWSSSPVSRAGRAPTAPPRRSPRRDRSRPSRPPGPRAGVRVQFQDLHR